MKIPSDVGFEDAAGKIRYLHTTLPLKKFNITKGETELTLYYVRSSNGIGCHGFCGVCGCNIFRVGKGREEVMVNLHLVEGLEVRESQNNVPRKLIVFFVLIRSLFRRYALSSAFSCNLVHDRSRFRYTLDRRRNPFHLHHQPPKKTLHRCNQHRNQCRPNQQQIRRN